MLSVLGLLEQRERERNSRSSSPFRPARLAQGHGQSQSSSSFAGAGGAANASATTASASAGGGAGAVASRGPRHVRHTDAPAPTSRALRRARLRDHVRVRGAARETAIALGAGGARREGVARARAWLEDELATTAAGTGTAARTPEAAAAVRRRAGDPDELLLKNQNLTA